MYGLGVAAIAWYVSKESFLYESFLQCSGSVLKLRRARVAHGVNVTFYLSVFFWKL